MLSFFCPFQDALVLSFSSSSVGPWVTSLGLFYLAFSVDAKQNKPKAEHFVYLSFLRFDDFFFHANSLSLLLIFMNPQHVYLVTIMVPLKPFRLYLYLFLFILYSFYSSQYYQMFVCLFFVFHVKILCYPRPSNFSSLNVILAL